MHARHWRQGFIIGLLLLVIVWLGTLVVDLVKKAGIAVSEAASVKSEYQSLEERKTVLENKIATLATPRGQDAAIRTAFGVARSGEEVIVVVPPATTTEERPLSWWDTFLSWF